MFDQDAFNADLATAFQFSDEQFQVEVSKFPTIFHYTNASGLFGILSSRSFRATHIKFLNDSKEYQYAREQIAKGVGSYLTHWRGLSLDEGYTLEVKEVIDTSMTELQKSLRADDAPPDLYVVCFCVDADKVDQWKSYGADGFGYSVGFRTNQLSAVPNCRLLRVNYGEPILTKLITRCMEYSAKVIEQYAKREYLDALISCFSAFLKDFTNEISPGFKHEGFRHEEEVRLVISGGSRPHRKAFVLRGSIVVPFWEVELGDFEKTAAGIIVGPSSYASIAQSGIVSYLQAQGMSAVATGISSQPYRVLR